MASEDVTDPEQSGPTGQPSGLGAALFEQSPLSTILYHPDGRIAAVNAAFTRLMGLDLSDLDGYSILTDAQLDRQGALPLVRRAFAGERVTLPPVRYDSREIAATGTATWTQAEMFPLRDAAGDITNVVLVHVDLTRHMEVEAALRRSEQELTGERLRLEGILNAVGDGITVQNAAGTIVYANDAAARVIGFDSADEFLSSSMIDILAGFEMFDEKGEPLPTSRLPGRRALAGETEPEELVRYRVRRTGEDYWSLVRSRAMRDSAGELLFVVNAFTDVTARIRQQRETEAARARAEWAEQRASFLAEAGRVLASSLEYEETLRSIAKLAVPRVADWCTVHLRDSDGSVRRLETAHVDPARRGVALDMEERYPLNPETSVITRVVRTGEPELLAELTPDLLASTAVDAEHLGMLEELGFESAMVVPLTAHGMTLGAMALISAESGRRYDEQDLEFALALAARAALAIHTAELYRQTQAANHAKAEFLAVMSHELRTPLNAILGYRDLLAEGIVGPINDQQKDHLGRIGESAKHLSQLIETVLVFAKIEAGRAEADLELADIASLVRSSVALVEPAAARKDLSIDVIIADEITLRTDVAKARQILLNLLSNAVKFTREGGVTVRLSAEGGGGGGRGETAAGRGGARIDVIDTGVGIREADIPRLWEPFTQIDPSLTRAEGGTGLGLPVSASLAELIDARIEVQSEPGKGSTFSLILGANADDRS